MATRLVWRKVHFRPWVGNGYGSKGSFGIPERTLVLGESHYSYEAEIQALPPKDLTQAVVERFCSGDPLPFFTKLCRSLADPDLPRAECADVMQRIAFANFVQELAGESPRIAPTPDAFKRGAEAFAQLVSNLKPTHVLAMGKRLWRHMPPFEGGALEGKVIKAQGVQSEYGVYAVAGHRCIAMVVQHPSWGFSPREWHPLVQKFLKLNSPS